jgi:hypothetical protein
MIEIGEQSEFKMTYDEAVMYCFCLGDGWRLPSQEEYHKYIPPYFGVTWYQEHGLWFNLPVIPVRDIIDD